MFVASSYVMSHQVVAAVLPSCTSALWKQYCITYLFLFHFLQGNKNWYDLNWTISWRQVCFVNSLFSSKYPWNRASDIIYGNRNSYFDTVFHRPYRYFSIALKVVLSLFDRYKIFTSNWLWIEICENVVLSKIDITLTTINKKVWNWLIKPNFVWSRPATATQMNSGNV